MRSHVTGATGRLGSVVVKTLRERGDEIVVRGEPTNYLVFAHRYRGPQSYEKEMFANVDWIVQWIETQTWAPGDQAIVIVSSVSAYDPAMNQSLAYNLSKAAQCQLVRHYARSQPIRINAILPSTFTGPAAVISPQQVADVIAFLCSPQASGINGQEIRVG